MWNSLIPVLCRMSRPMSILYDCMARRTLKVFVHIFMRHTSNHHWSESMVWLQKVYIWRHRCRFCLFWSHTYLIDFYCGRRGEEHSFILKPAALLGRDIKAYGERSSQSSQVAIGASNLPLISRIGEAISTSGDQYAVLVSCRCNYTGMLLREK